MTNTQNTEPTSTPSPIVFVTTAEVEHANKAKQNGES